MKYILLIAISFGLIFTSCSSDKKETESAGAVDIADLTHYEDGAIAKIIKSGNTELLKVGDILRMFLLIKDGKDTLFYAGAHDPMIFQLTNPNFTTSLEQTLLRMSVGDSAEVAINSDSLISYLASSGKDPNLKPGTFIRYSVKVYNKKNEEQEIAQLADKYQLTNNKEEEGYYFKELKKGSGKLLKPGQEVSVNFRGYFGDNGEVFFSNLKEDKHLAPDGEKMEPMVVKIDDEELLACWKLAFQKMSVGSKALILTPSYLAFGPRGDNYKIEPFSTLMYELEIVK